MKQLTIKEIKRFTKNCNELIEYSTLHGKPTDETNLVIDKMMYYRLDSIKKRPELLEIAKKIDKKSILF